MQSVRFMSDELASCVQDAAAEAGQRLGSGQEAHVPQSAPMPSHTSDHPAGVNHSCSEYLLLFPRKPCVLIADMLLRHAAQQQ